MTVSYYLLRSGMFKRDEQGRVFRWSNWLRAWFRTNFTYHEKKEILKRCSKKAYYH